MSLWGVRVVMGSSFESLGTSFWDPLGVICEALGCHFGSFWDHFGSLGGHWATFWTFEARQKAIYPQDGSAEHTFVILSSQNGPRWLSKWNQNGQNIDQKMDPKKDAEKDRKKEASEATRTSLGPRKPSQIIAKRSIWGKSGFLRKVSKDGPQSHLKAPKMEPTWCNNR